MYIRNHYLWNKELSFKPICVDDLSTEIVEEIIRRVQEEASEVRGRLRTVRLLSYPAVYTKAR